MDRSSIILDSNILFAYYVEEDSLHEKSIEIMELIDTAGSQVYVTYGVLLEVSTLLSRRYGKSYADLFIQDCLSASNFVLVSGDIEKDAKRFLGHSDRMAFVDHILIHIAEEHDGILLTFDEQLMKRYKAGW